LSTKLDYYHGNTGGDEGVDQTARRWMASPHNPMLDEHGRLWMTEPVRRPGVENNPKWSAGTVAMDADDPAAIDIAAKALASRNHGMQLGYYDTKTGKFVGVDTSYNTHHLQLDWQGRIWSDEDVLGRPIRYPRARQKYGDRYRDDHGFHADFRSEEGNAFCVPHAVPDAVLYARPGRSNR
jgi:hypothetical protein